MSSSKMIFKFWFICLDPFLDVENAAVKSAVCMALGEIGKTTALMLPPGGDGDAEGGITKLSITNKLIGIIKTSKEINKVLITLDDYQTNRNLLFYG